MARPQHTCPRRRRPTGFSLVEVMIALGIFALGFIAVASIFPVAVLLQKNTMDDLTGRIFAQNAEAMVLTKGFDVARVNAAWTAAGSNDDTVFPQTTSGLGIVLADWTVNDRSYPATISDAARRRAFWTPLFYADDGDAAVTGTPPDYSPRGYRVYLFIVKSRDGAVYDKSSGTWAANDPTTVPGVRYQNASIAGSSVSFSNTSGGERLVRVGDVILLSNGNAVAVTDATDSGVTINGGAGAGAAGFWFAHPGDSGQSACVDVLTLTYNTGTNRRLIR